MVEEKLAFTRVVSSPSFLVPRLGLEAGDAHLSCVLPAVPSAFPQPDVFTLLSALISSPWRPLCSAPVSVSVPWVWRPEHRPRGAREPASSTVAYWGTADFACDNIVPS